MDNALSLLKTAIADNDIQDRTERVIKACKLITDFLPFAGEGKAITLEPELVKYLMLSVPFNARSIEWLIFSMFDKFKYNKQFLKQLWIGFSAIAFLSDKDGNEPKKENTGLRKFQTEMRKVLSLSKSSVSDDGVFESQIFKNQDFCDIIKENKEIIKLSCLKQIKRFLGVYYKELVSALNFKPDFAELLKKFLLHTSNGKIIIKTVKVIEKLRQEDPFSCDIEIEDILISKQNCIFDTPIQQTTETAQQKPWGRTNTMKPNQRTKSVLTRMNTLHDSNILNSINSRPILKKAASLLIDEAELKPKESKEASAVLKENDELRRLEEWLSGDEIGQPALMNNRADLKTYIYNFENFEYLLSFIFDPEAQPLALCWEENYSSILNAISEEDDKASDISQYSTPPKLNKDDDLKYSKLYVLRSFKTAQALGDERNFNQIFDQNKEALESYFYNIYNTLSIRKDTSCNYHHIGLLTESLVRRESDLCVGFILYYNLLYNFIQKIEVPHFQKLLLTLFKASENAKDMQFEAYAKLLRYCQSSSFFSDISLAILRGWNSFQASKFNVDYKPPGVEDLVSLAMERSEPRMLTDKSIVQSTVDLKDSFLTQELLNFQVDIDNLQSVLEKDTQIDREALLQTTQMSTPKKLKQKKYSNYPSLAELESERGTLLGSIDLSETRRGSIDNGDHNLLNTQTGKNLASMHLSHRKNAHSRVSVESQKLKGTLTPSINNSSSKKENRNVTLDPGFKDTKSGIAKKLDFDSTKPSAVKQPEGILKKVGKYTVSSLDAIPDELQTKEKPVKSLNYLGVIRRKPGTKKGFIRPIKNTVSMDLDKEAIDHEKIAELDKLYPTSARAKTSIELEASGEEYNVSNLLENDHFSLALCEFLEVLFRNALLSKPFDVDEMEKRLESGLGTYLFNQRNLNQMKQKYENKRNIGVSELDFFAFWQAIFSSNCALFENLLKNYLFKIKLHHIQENNSGYAAGVLVNLILEECVKGNPYFEPYLEQIRSICKKHMPMLCKTIVQSHAWKQRDSDKVYLQDFQVKHPLGAGRIQLVQTLKLFIENDCEQKYQICNRITDTCWHVLMIWFANNKTNNMYHQIFYTIFEITFLHSEESLLTDILVKLGFIANMYKVWSDIFQNNMLRKDNHIESILYHLKKLVYLIEFVAQRNEDYKILKRELKRSLSWEIVKSGLLPDKENPKSESRPGSENRQTFSNSFSSRRRKNGQVLDELTASKIENKSRHRLDSETSFEFPEGSARDGRISSIEKFVY